MTEFDIFISYRRVGGFETAKHLYDLLRHEGYSVSFDIDTLREGKFNVALLSRIKMCQDFVLIVDPHAFDRTLDPNFNPEQDWLRQELSYALSLQKNVIPILLSGASFPEGLPDDICDVRYMNGPGYSKDYFDAFYNKLKSLLHSKPKSDESPILELSKPEKQKGAEIHIYTNENCRVLSYGQEIGTATKDNDSIIVLQRGKYRLSFISIDYPQAILEKEFVVDNQLYDYIDVDLITIKEKRLEKEAELNLRRGQQAKDSRNYKEAFSCFFNAATSGNVTAQYELGECYYYGHGVSVDYSKAIHWYHQAAKQGYNEAEFALGYCYHIGKGVQVDYRKAFGYFNDASLSGNRFAQNYLGAYYYKGLGTEKNIDLAIEWFKKSASQGVADSQCSLGNIYHDRQDYSEALYWYEKAADNGHGNASYVLSKIYLKEPKYDKYPVSTDWDKHIKFIEKAAEKGIPHAQFWWGWHLVRNAKMGVNNHDEGMNWLKKAANNGVSAAMFELGRLYFWGYNWNKATADRNEGVRWYKMAAEKGNKEAKDELNRIGIKWP